VSTATPDAVRRVFDWFFANGGSNLPFHSAPGIPGLTPIIGDSLKSPNTVEYAAGINRQFGARAAVRSDFVFRDYRDFYVSRIDTATGRVSDPFGRPFDLAIIENSNVPERQYAGVTTQATYRFGGRTDIGGSYTISRSWGNFDGETVVNGPVAFSGLQYPEYKQAEWNYPVGDLSIDQRHRGRLWLNFGVPRVEGLTLSLLQALESGVPYGAGGLPLQGGNPNGVNAQPHVTNPGGAYATPPPGSATAYYYAARDAFRTEGQRRTDFAANYSYRIPGLANVQVFGQVQIVNLFNQFQLCGCGDTVFLNGGNVTATRIDTSVRNNVTHPTLYPNFNPFTTTPIEGTHWVKGPNFGHALNRFAYTSPRQFRVSFGVRF
jgi:hypothetical protein